ncbi:MAG: copper-translocating P-type ATPase [Bacillota bacterium]
MQEKHTNKSEHSEHTQNDHSGMHHEHGDTSDDSLWHEMAEEHKKHSHRSKGEIDSSGTADAKMHSHDDKKERGHEGHNHHEMMIEDFKKRFRISLVLTIPILIISPMIQEFLGLKNTLRFNGDSYLLFILSSAVYFYGGWPFLSGLTDEFKKLKPGMMTLVAMAISVAYFYSSAVTFGLRGEIFFWELATLIDIMLLGHWIEMRSVLGASRALEELVKLMPSEAHKINTDGSVTEVQIEELRHEDIVLIKPGEKIPVDGEVIDGDTSINESMISGESKPVDKKKGDTVTGGSINGEGSVKVIVKKLGSETFLSQVVEMVKSAQESKSQTQTLADRAAMWLTLIAILGGVITLFVWTLVMEHSFNFALTRTVTVMVIACPHALGLAIPLVVAVSTAISAKSGLLIRNRAAFESARNINAVIFDKTGTLTKGEFGVTDVVLLNTELTEAEAVKYAASVEANSEHPIAQGIVKKSDGIYEVSEFNSIPGKGVTGRVNGHEIKVVSPGYLTENKIITDNQEKVSQLSEQGKTVVYLITDNKPSAAIALADIIRDESRQAIEQLRQMGIRSIMLTGDNRQVAKWVSGELKVDEYFAEVLPDQKAAKIKEVQSRKLKVAMTGDGVNDAPALAQADVGIAVGAGTDVAIETADVILVNSNPQDVVSVVKFSKATYRKMIQNLLWAAGYNIITIPLAAGVLYSMGVLLDPALGAVLMTLSTVIVAVNSKFLKME